MKVEIIDNFKFGRVGDRITGLLVESDRIQETVEYIKKNNIKAIELNFYHGYLLKNIDFVTEVAEIIEDISIVTDDINLKHIEEVKNLKRIFVGGENKSPIDFSYFKYLESCNISWHKELRNLSACKYLSELRLGKFIYNDKNSYFIEDLPQVKILSFTQCKFENLELVKFFPNLETLEIYYNASLVNIDRLSHCRSTLNKLILDHCKNINSYDVLEELTKLRFLNITDNKSIKSLRFIKSLKNLEHLSFVGTDVLDGDLTPCIGIKFVGFFDKKHYSHTSADFSKVL